MKYPWDYQPSADELLRQSYGNGGTIDALTGKQVDHASDPFAPEPVRHDFNSNGIGLARTPERAADEAWATTPGSPWNFRENHPYKAAIGDMLSAPGVDKVMMMASFMGPGVKWPIGSPRRFYAIEGPHSAYEGGFHRPPLAEFSATSPESLRRELASIQSQIPDRFNLAYELPEATVYPGKTSRYDILMDRHRDKLNPVYAKHLSPNDSYVSSMPPQILQPMEFRRGFIDHPTAIRAWDNHVVGVHDLMNYDQMLKGLIGDAVTTPAPTTFGGSVVPFRRR